MRSDILLRTNGLGAVFFQSNRKGKGKGRNPISRRTNLTAIGQYGVRCGLARQRQRCRNKDSESGEHLAEALLMSYKK